MHGRKFTKENNHIEHKEHTLEKEYLNIVFKRFQPRTCSSFIAADTPAVTKEISMQMDNRFRLEEGNAA